MIDPDQLRIGNWIEDRGGKQWQIDYWESPGKVAGKEPYLGEGPIGPMYGHPFTEEWQYLQPIPLTEEWLIRLGFERLSSGYWYYGVIEIGYTTTDEYLQYEYLTGAEGSITEMLDLKYVHQLQNLYFALTGTELTIKE